MRSTSLLSLSMHQYPCKGLIQAVSWSFRVWNPKTRAYFSRSPIWLEASLRACLGTSLMRSTSLLSQSRHQYPCKGLIQVVSWGVRVWNPQTRAYLSRSSRWLEASRRACLGTGLMRSTSLLSQSRHRYPCKDLIQVVSWGVRVWNP